MVDVVAKAMCEAAGKSVNPDQCSCCEIINGDRKCLYWETFREEAKSAILAAYKWHRKERRWPQFCKE